MNHLPDIERIEARRELNPDTDAVYILSPHPHVVDCLLADLEVGRYRSAYLLWTAVLDPTLLRKLENGRGYAQRRAGFDTILIDDIYPRESHLITFRDPWSFPILFHPACNDLVRAHLQKLAQRVGWLVLVLVMVMVVTLRGRRILADQESLRCQIMSTCVLLGECPRVRFYKPREPTHEASVLCQHLARFVQEELDEYSRFTAGFGKGSGRPQGVLVITDRSMDLMAPLLHELTYQAMAHDLLAIKDTDKVRIRLCINEGRPDAEDKDMELHDGDKIWVDNRHRHMKDTLDKLVTDFHKFIEANAHFAKESGSKTIINTLQDMLAGLPQFMTQKEAYSLHIDMAQKCMTAFKHQKLFDLFSLEQSLVTGLDEVAKKPKNILDDIVGLLDDASIIPSDRLRLLLLYVLYRDGLIPEDVKRLLAHSQLSPSEGEAVSNLALLGARPTRVFKEQRPPLPLLFPTKGTKQQQQQPLLFGAAATAAADNDDGANMLSRYETALQTMLDNLCRGTLDPAIFPYQRDPSDPSQDLLTAQPGSLRAGRAQWASSARRPPENCQRIIVFMAGGATYSESRVCYDMSTRHGRDIFLVSSHMITPRLFIRQLADLSANRRKLDLPVDRPQPKMPSYLFERPAPPVVNNAPVQQQRQQQQQQSSSSSSYRGPEFHIAPSPPAAAMSRLSLGSSNNSSPSMLEKPKKKRNFFGMRM